MPELKIENAKEYFLVPIQDQQSLYYIGGKNKLNALMIVMDAKKVVATTGMMNDRCYILVDGDNAFCEDMQNQMNEALKKTKTK